MQLRGRGTDVNGVPALRIVLVRRAAHVCRGARRLGLHPALPAVARAEPHAAGRQQCPALGRLAHVRLAQRPQRLDVLHAHHHGVLARELREYVRQVPAAAADVEDAARSLRGARAAVTAALVGQEVREEGLGGVGVHVRRADGRLVPNRLRRVLVGRLGGVVGPVHGEEGALHGLLGYHAVCVEVLD